MRRFTSLRIGRKSTDAMGCTRCDVLADRPRLGGVESMAHPPPTVQSQDPGGFVGKLQTMQCVFWYHPRAFAALYGGTQQIGIDYPMDLLERNSCYASCFICQQYRLFGTLWPSGTNITGLNDGFQYEWSKLGSSNNVPASWSGSLSAMESIAFPHMWRHSPPRNQCPLRLAAMLGFTRPAFLRARAYIGTTRSRRNYTVRRYRQYYKHTPCTECRNGNSREMSATVLPHGPI